MKKNRLRRRRSILLSAVGLVVVAVGVLVAQTNLDRAQAITVTAVTTKITINSQIGETFAPPLNTASPTLTAEQAYAQYEQHIGSSATTIPSGVTVQLGLLTLPVGPANSETGNLPTQNGIAYTALNELAYGYSWHSCPMTLTLGPSSLPSNPCIEWNFIDANTGQQIGMTWQQ